MVKRLIRRLSTRAASATILLLIAACVDAQQSTTATSSPAPKALLPFTSYAFDDVYRGEIISYIFLIRNVGTADLLIKDFIAGCSCEVIEADRVIPPGKEGKAHVEINTAGVIGGAVKTATLLTNDPERPAIVLTLIANVLSNSDGSPISGAVLREGKHIGPLFVGPALRWGAQVATGEKTRTEFAISVGRGPVKVLRVDGDQSHFACRIETIEDAKRYRLVIETVPADEPGRHDATLRVVTDSPVLPYFEIKLFLNVRQKEVRGCRREPFPQLNYFTNPPHLVCPCAIVEFTGEDCLPDNRSPTLITPPQSTRMRISRYGLTSFLSRSV